MSADIVVREVASFWDKRRFMNLPWSIYGATDSGAIGSAAKGSVRDPNWVPPIISQEKLLLGWGHHPFFENAEIVTLLALRNGTPVGRLAAFTNRIHNQKYKDKVGFFGFFECIDDAAVAQALFKTGEAWLLKRGMTHVRGPANPSLNYTCGLLVQGFDTAPVFLMTYNPPYYEKLVESAGFTKAQDLYTYEMEPQLLAAIAERYKPVVQSARERPGLKIRQLDPKRFEQEILTYLDIYNRSLDGTWGFTPLQPGEVKHIASELKNLIIPELTSIAEVDGKPIGAFLALLDYNQIIRKINGRLLPFGLIQLITGQRKITLARGLGMTMVPGYQSAGLGIVLLDAVADQAKKFGITKWEFSWVLETNYKSRGSLERVGMTVVKIYRIYDKAL